MWASVLVGRKNQNQTQNRRGKPAQPQLSEEAGMMGQQAPVGAEWILMELQFAMLEDLLGKSGWPKVQSITSTSHLSYLQNCYEFIFKTNKQTC